MPNRPSPRTATPPFDSTLIWSSVTTSTPPSGDSVTAESIRSLLQAGHTALGTGNWGDALDVLNTAYDRMATQDFAAMGAEAAEASDAAELFIVMGLTRFFRDELELAEEAFETAYAIAVLSHLEQARARAANGLGIVAARRSNFGAAEQYYAEVRTRADRLGDTRLVAIADTNLAILANDRGERGRALVRWGAALEHFRRLGDDRNATAVLSNIAQACLEMGDREGAISALSEAERLAQACGDRLQQGLLTVFASEVAFERGDLSEALELASRAVSVLLQIGSRDQLAGAFFAKGRVLRAKGSLAEADAQFAVALRVAELSADRALIAKIESERALGLVAASRNRDAFKSLNRAIRVYEEIGLETALARVRRQLESLEQVSTNMAQEWAVEIDRHTGYADGHAAAVAETAVRLADASNIPSRERHLVRLGALLHDAGMAVLPAELFASPRQLTQASRDLVMLHTETGADTVAALDFPAEVGSIVRHHHEHWDGTGYPDRLASDAIPMSARVVAVASVWHALRSSRPHRAAYSANEAREHMAQMAGTMLDPSIVKQLFLNGVLDDAPIAHAATPPNASSLTTAERLRQALAPKYEVEGPLSRGETSDLYVACEKAVDRRVTVKVLLREVCDVAAAERFQRELMTATRLQHPAILPVHASALKHGLLFYVSAYAEGDSLRQRLDRDASLGLEETYEIVRSLLDALDYTHTHGIVHRDITPETILLTEHGAMLTDAGVAQAIDAADLGEPGVLVGTPAYMAPEQLGEPVGPAADIYSLALVMYEMLAGVHPYASHATLGTHLTALAEPLSSFRSDAPRELSDALAKAMAKAPEDRFQSVAEVRAAFFPA